MKVAIFGLCCEIEIVLAVGILAFAIRFLRKFFWKDPHLE